MDIRMLDPDEPGYFFNFRNSLPHNEYYAVKPQFMPPHGARPIVDDATRLCIGYTVAQAPGLWQVYDADGRFTTLEEAPLQTPLIDPLDIALIAFGVFRLLSSGRAVLDVAAGKSIGSVLSEATLNMLRGRLKVGLSVRNLKFTRTTAAHMAESGRYIPVNILEKAIRYGSRSPDAQKMPGMFLYRIKMTRLKKIVEHDKIRYVHKEYTLHVVVRERDWTISHFHID